MAAHEPKAGRSLPLRPEESPEELRDDAWRQACLPSEGFGGFNLTNSSCTADEHGNTINHLYSATFLSCYSRLRKTMPDLRDINSLDDDAPRFIKEAVAGYSSAQRLRAVLERTHAAMQRDKYHTLRGGTLTPHHPLGLPLPATLPTAAKLLDPTSIYKTPSSGKLAMVNNISAWHELMSILRKRDARRKTNGDSAVKNREASRLVSASQPYAGAWHAIPPDGTNRTKLATPQWKIAVQRQLGLHLSGAKPALLDLAEMGETVDFFGDDASNGAGMFSKVDGDKKSGGANHNRRHNAALNGWHAAISAVATTQTVQGDKQNGARTKQFNDYNDGHVVDIAEIGSGERGEDKCLEIKVFATLGEAKCKAAGLGSTVNGGTVKAVGHKYPFGNNEEKCRLENLGCKTRGRPSDGFFKHDTGTGYVKGRQGAYHDALFKKNNTVEILLHENLGGGFSPPAAHKIRRNGRKARNHGIDRTPYMSDRKMSYVSFHTRAISMGITKSESQTLMDAASKLKGILCVKRTGSPAALS